MCGIMGYIGTKDVIEVLIAGLKRLQYRGYDSCGIAVLTQGELLVAKEAGKIERLEHTLREWSIPGGVGIAHTRWATHGSVTRENAHPHLDCNGEVAIVHNGIIENYSELREKLIRRGHIVRSGTDSELLAHLIEENLERGIEDAVREAVSKVEGTYALACISVHAPEGMIVARRGAPLVVGLGKGENFVASDIPALLPLTREVDALEDGEVAWITAHEVRIWKASGEERSVRPVQIGWEVSEVDKEGFPSFMLKEIFEQPTKLSDIIRKRIRGKEVVFEELSLPPRDLVRVERFVIQACGTSWHAGLYARYLFERYPRVPTDAEISSEFRYRDPVLDGNVMVIGISQSGETADTLAGVRQARSRFIPVISFCNVPGSTITRESDGVVHLLAGPEIGVASTKAYTAQLAHLFLFALYLARLKWVVGEEEMEAKLAEFASLPGKMRWILEAQEPRVREAARKLADARYFLYIARNINYPTALEGALKLKEISYIHATGYPAGELKHGPIALVDRETPVVCICPRDSVYTKMLSNMEEVKSRGGRIVAVATEGDGKAAELADEIFYVPETVEELTPLLTVIPLQLLAHHIAMLKGLDVDKPRNLAKSVTVE